MNTASQDFPKHLGILRERMLNPADYETAVHYFLEEFCGDEQFIMLSEREESPALLAVLTKVVSSAMNRNVKFEESKIFLLSGQRFYHGNASAEGRVVLFFYFKVVETGIAALIPGTRGATEIVRFQLPKGLVDPKRN